MVQWLQITCFCADAFIWWRMNRLLGGFCYRRQWRIGLAILMTVPILFLAISIADSLPMRGTQDPLPHWLVTTMYTWHILVLPWMLLALLIDLFARFVVFLYHCARSSRCFPAPQPPPGPILSRRNFLTAAGLTLAPAAAIAMGGIAVAQIGKFRIKSYDLALAGWPKGLNGYRIAVVADPHVGVFSTPKMLRDIADATNNLRCNLILNAGDLVNVCHSDLPSALDMVTSMDAPDGVYIIQGNHDVVQGPQGFNNACRQRGVNLLVDEVATINARGGAFQLLGTRWTVDPYRDQSVAYTAALRDHQLFPIMLAHHPHSWDKARLCGIPLVFAGHTHGGQLMLTETLGAGPLRFKYWTGRYDAPGSALIVSNGVGDWFPLRINAPKEILQITLHPLV
jgi:predicted MPP superfamily phosphohydrolase